MRLLLNLAEEDKTRLGMFGAILKQNSLPDAVASFKSYELQQLQDKAKLANCDAIICSNSETLQKITGRPKASLDSFRGSRFNFERPLFIINPLEHLQTVDHGRWLLDRDLDKVHHARMAPVPFRWKKADTRALYEQLLDDVAHAELMAFDIETNPAYRMITCVSFALLMPDMTFRVWVLPFFNFNQRHHPDPDSYASALNCFRCVMSSGVPKIAHNGIYDATYCITYHAEPRNYIGDTLILGWSRYSELERTLDFNASLYLYDYCQWKHESDDASANKDIMSYWAYCAKDSWTTLRIALQQLGLSTGSDYWIHNYRRTFRLSYPAIYTAFEGCRINTAKRDELRSSAEKQLRQLEADFKKMTAEPRYNPASPQQVAKFLYEIMGAVKPKSKSKTATDEKSLNQVAMQHPLLARIVDAQLKFKELQKQLTTYYSFHVFNDTRALWTIDPTGTESARMASKKSPFCLWDSEEHEPAALGLQIQNIPTEGVKVFFIPDDGFVLFEIDKSKSEARCIAYMSQCQKMINTLEDTVKDYYKVLSSEFFAIPYDQVTTYMRNKITKKIIHGSNYLLGALTFIATVTPKEMFRAMQELGKKMALKDFANYLLGLYHTTFPELKQEGGYYDQIMREIKLTKHWVSPLGFTRRFFGATGGSGAHKTLRSAVAHTGQNLSVDLLNDDFWQDYLLVLDSGGALRLKAQIHDSRFGQVRIDRKDYYMKIMTERTQPVTIHNKTMVIPSECKIGKNNWQDVEEWHSGKEAHTSS